MDCSKRNRMQCVNKEIRMQYAKAGSRVKGLGRSAARVTPLNRSTGGRAWEDQRPLIP